MDLSYYIGKNIVIQGKYEIILDTEHTTKFSGPSIFPEFEGIGKHDKNKLPLP